MVDNSLSPGYISVMENELPQLTNGQLIELLMQLPLDALVSRDDGYDPAYGRIQASVTEVALEDNEVVIR